MEMMQNYAKFDSRIAEESMNQVADYSWANYSNGFSLFDSISNIIWDIVSLLMFSIWTIIVITGVFLFLYLLVSLFTRWWEKTLIDFKKISNWFFWLIKNIILKIYDIFNKTFLFFWKRKTISILLVLIICLVNFTSSVIDWKSRLLKLSKINSWFVWVDLKNNKILNPGYHLYSPIKTNFFLSPTNNFDFEIAEVTANTIEDLWVTLDYRVWFKIKSDQRLAFYNSYGSKSIKLVSSDVVMPRLLEVIKGIIRNYSFKDISSKHNEIKNITIDEANKVLWPIWVELQDITILDIRLPKSYLVSKEDLLKSENELKLAEARLETQKKESERKILEAENIKKVRIIEAESVAEYNKIITSEKIGDDAIEMKRLELEKLKIEKWDWKMPTHIDWNFEL